MIVIVLMKNMLIFLSLSSYGILWSADGMTLIKRWQDLKPFESQIVAYTSTSFVLNQGNDAFTLQKDTLGHFTIERYGVVDNQRELISLLKKDAPSSSSICNLSEHLSEGNLAMRVVTETEEGQLKEAVEKDLAKLVFIFDTKKETYVNNKEESLKLLNECTTIVNVKPAKR